MSTITPKGNIPTGIKNKIGKNLYQIQNHPISIIKNKIYDFFADREKIEGLDPNVNVKSNFDDLLIDKDHPSRSPSDTFYKNENTVLRTHTSAHQTEFIKQGKKNFLVTGDVYRKDEIDKFHYPIFHQMEGVTILPYVEDPMNICDTIRKELGELIIHLFPNSEFRFVDTFFPFTSVSCEVEVLLKNKWVEVLGAGVIKEKILNDCGLNNSSGWAFGLGLERLAMILFEIPDIRYFWTEDKRFLDQFQKGQISKFKEYSKYPSITRDISFFHKEDFKPNDFYTFLNDSSENLISETKILDEFQNVKTGQKSISFRINFESLEKTLTSDEVNEKMIEIKSFLTEKYDVIIR